MDVHSPSQPSSYTHTQNQPQSHKPNLTPNPVPPQTNDDYSASTAGVSGSIVSSTIIEIPRVTELGNVSPPPSKIPLRPRKIRKLSPDDDASNSDGFKEEHNLSQVMTPLTRTANPAVKSKLSQSRTITVPRIYARSLTCEGELEAAIRHLRSVDPLLASLVDIHPPPTLEFHTPFLALVRSILYQNLAVKAGKYSIYTRFVALCGVVPENVLPLTPQQLSQIGVSDWKASYLHDLARKYLNGILSDSAILNMDEKSLFTMLAMVNGIGSRSIHMFMINSLHRPDVLPVNDRGLRKGVQMLYDLPELPRPLQMEHLCEKWRPYRSVASWYMWRLIEANGTPTNAAAMTAGSALSFPQVEDIQQQQQHQSQQQRFRTKFTTEQKRRMMEFAEKLGWWMNKQDEEELNRFCGEIGVKRQVFKVWMHNNRNIARKPPAPPTTL